jgi:hypothetical protein
MYRSVGVLCSCLLFAASVHAQTLGIPSVVGADSGVVGDRITFRWDMVPGASWYNVFVQDSVRIFLNAWYTSAQANCMTTGSICTVIVTIPPFQGIVPGTVHWWVRPWMAPSTYGPWSARQEFQYVGRSDPVMVTYGPDAVRAGMSAGGSGITAIGHSAFRSLATGTSSTVVGSGALASMTTSLADTAVGAGALPQLITGNFNTVLGTGAGVNLQNGFDNIYIGVFAGVGNTQESLTIRIGGGETPQTRTFIAGIHGRTSAGGSAVFVNSAGQLGTLTSSRRYKTNIKAIKGESSALFRLRPVSFTYKPEIDQQAIRQYGLIAEEVASVLPALVERDAVGEPDSVRYHLLVPLLLNELQNQQRRLEKQKTEIQRLAMELERVQRRARQK